MLVMQDHEVNVIRQPCLIGAPVVEGVFPAVVLLRPVCDQGICQGVAALCRQVEIQRTDALDRSIGSRQGCHRFRTDVALAAQICSIKKPGIDREAGG